MHLNILLTLSMSLTLTMISASSSQGRKPWEMKEPRRVPSHMMYSTPASVSSVCSTCNRPRYSCKKVTLTNQSLLFVYIYILVTIHILQLFIMMVIAYDAIVIIDQIWNILNYFFQAKQRNETYSWTLHVVCMMIAIYYWYPLLIAQLITPVEPLLHANEDCISLNTMCLAMMFMLYWLISYI